MLVDRNRPDCAGAVASQKFVFGDRSRYALYAVHTRFDAVEWFIVDAETLEYDGTMSVLAQKATIEQAMEYALSLAPDDIPLASTTPVRERKVKSQAGAL